MSCWKDGSGRRWSWLFSVYRLQLAANYFYELWTEHRKNRSIKNCRYRRRLFFVPWQSRVMLRKVHHEHCATKLKNGPKQWDNLRAISLSGSRTPPLFFETNFIYDFGTLKKTAQLQYPARKALHFVLSDLRGGVAHRGLFWQKFMEAPYWYGSSLVNRLV